MKRGRSPTSCEPGDGYNAMAEGRAVSIVTLAVAGADSSPTPFLTFTHSLRGPSPAVNAQVADRWNDCHGAYALPSPLKLISVTPDRSSLAVSVTETASTWLVDGLPPASTIETVGGVGSGTVWTVRR